MPNQTTLAGGPAGTARRDVPGELGAQAALFV